MHPPTQEYLKSILSYDIETGLFTWATKRNGTRTDGIAGFETSQGYISIYIDGKNYRAHRLAWLYMKGEFPSNGLDHINGIKNDNRWLNLREATTSENLWNVGLTRRNKSGYKGVHWHKHSGKWYAKCRLNNKEIYLGIFETPELAGKAYREFAQEHHGEFYKVLSS